MNAWSKKFQWLTSMANLGISFVKRQYSSVWVKFLKRPQVNISLSSLDNANTDGFGGGNEMTGSKT